MLHMVHCLKSEYTNKSSFPFSKQSYYFDAHILNVILKFYMRLLFVVLKGFPVMMVINIVTIPIFSAILSNVNELCRMSKSNCLMLVKNIIKALKG